MKSPTLKIQFITSSLPDGSKLMKHVKCVIVDITTPQNNKVRRPNLTAMGITKKANDNRVKVIAGGRKLELGCFSNIIGA